jgi:S-adenosyl methyltransferase
MTGGGGSRRPDAGRIYNCLLGGKDNYEQDRQAAAQLLAVVPGARAAARANRRFVGRAVRFLAAEAGIGQFIDIGTGLPAAGSVHQVARELNPGARVAYVDNDPVVVSHARALLCTAPGICAADGDLRDPAAITAHPDVRAVIDLSEPAAVVLAAVLHHIPDQDSPHKLVGMLMAAVAPGSYLVVSHATGEGIGAAAAGQVQELYAQAGLPVVFRSRAEVAGFFEGLELVPPGIGSAGQPHRHARARSSRHDHGPGQPRQRAGSRRPARRRGRRAGRGGHPQRADAGSR